MIWKELKCGNYKNYGYHIYGKYTEDYPTEIDGKIAYKESIETKIKIMNPLGDVIHEMHWLEYHQTKYEKINFQYLIRFRPILKFRWYKMMPKLLDVIHIEDDYVRVLNNWKSYAEQIIDGQLKDFEKEKYEQEITDGLPDSVFIKYLDR